MSVTIPDAILETTRMSASELKLEIAVMLYQLEKLSAGKAAELAGMDGYRFRQLLASRGVELAYDEQDFEDDLATLRSTGRI
jgi:predicted HTH domain antitoxin